MSGILATRTGATRPAPGGAHEVKLLAPHDVAGKLARHTQRQLAQAPQQRPADALGPEPSISPSESGCKGSGGMSIGRSHWCLFSGARERFARCTICSRLRWHVTCQSSTSMSVPQGAAQACPVLSMFTLGTLAGMHVKCSTSRKYSYTAATCHAITQRCGLPAAPAGRAGHEDAPRGQVLPLAAARNLSRWSRCRAL